MYMFTNNQISFLAKLKKKKIIFSGINSGCTSFILPLGCSGLTVLSKYPIVDVSILIYTNSTGQGGGECVISVILKKNYLCVWSTVNSFLKLQFSFIFLPWVFIYSRIQSFKYQRTTTSGCKDTGIAKIEFVDSLTSSDVAKLSLKFGST